MRVLHLGKFYPPTPGGIERVLQSLGVESASAGVATAVLAHAPPGKWQSREWSDAGVAIREVGCFGQFLYAPISPGLPWQLARAIREFRPDLLHLHLPNTSAFAALALPVARHLPWVIHWHADIPLDSGSRALRLAYPLYRPWEQALLRRAAAIVATSPNYRDASSALQPWQAKVEVIPLGIGNSAPAQVDERSTLWPPSSFRLLAVGRLSHYKGFDVLLRAVAELPQVSLLLIGSGEESGRLRQLVDTLALHGRVQLAGHVDEATLQRAYAEADAFCLPSLDRAEAFGVVLLEAMRAALPIVASDVPGSGIGYVLRRNETALMVAPGNPAELVAALRDLMQDPALRQRLGAAGRQRWHASFTPMQTTPALLDLYRQVLASR
jgi:glycosyltransferase involved in cell wall biosynthesis